jgi:hypothetical protein
MKTMIPFCCLLALGACNNTQKNTITDTTLVKTDSIITTPTAVKDTARIVYTSPLRKGDTLVKGKVYVDTVSFITYNDNGDDALFVCVKDKDTVGVFFRAADAPKLNNGDKVRLAWSMDMYAPAGDPDYPYPAEFVTDYHLLQPGKVTLLKKVYPLLQGHYNDKEISSTGQEEIDAAVWYYVANTTDTAIRNVVDVERQALQYTVEKYEGQGDPAISNIIFTTASRPALKRVAFNAERPYSLME